VCALCESDGRDKNEAAALFDFCARLSAALLQAAAAAAAAAQAGCSQGGENGLKGVKFTLQGLTRFCFADQNLHGHAFGSERVFGHSVC